MTAETPRTQIVAARLDALSLAVAEGRRDEFTMRIPVEPDRDADLVLAEAARMVRDLTAARARVAELETGLRTLIRGYVSTLENGRDRIVMLGGQCDPLEQMEREDPHLRVARALLAPSP